MGRLDDARRQIDLLEHHGDSLTAVPDAIGVKAAGSIVRSE